MTVRPSPTDEGADRTGRDHGRERPRDGGSSAQAPPADEQASMDEAIDRATAAVGQDDGRR